MADQSTVKVMLARSKNYEKKVRRIWDVEATLSSSFAFLIGMMNSNSTLDWIEWIEKLFSQEITGKLSSGLDSMRKRRAKNTHFWCVFISRIINIRRQRDDAKVNCARYKIEVERNEREANFHSAIKKKFFLVLKFLALWRDENSASFSLPRSPSNRTFWQNGGGLLGVARGWSFEFK